MTLQHFLILLILTTFACGKNNQTNSNEANSLTPFEMTIGTGTDITPEDRQKLANAKGRKVEMLTIKELQQQIQVAEGKLHLFYFWSMKDKELLVFHQVLEKIALEEAENVNVVLVNIDHINEQKAVNAYLRTQGITAKAYQLNLKNAESIQIDEDWDGKLPYLLLVNQSDKTFLAYHQTLSYEALYAILQPLL